jgi:pimeloyl-ACP methyl ester carboxylesterase
MKLHSAVTGTTGHCVLLIHGIGNDTTYFTSLTKMLVSSGFRCVSVDLRGHGNSLKPVSSIELSTLASDVLETM